MMALELCLKQNKKVLFINSEDKTLRKLALSPQAAAPKDVAELYMSTRKREFSTDSLQPLGILPQDGVPSPVHTNKEVKTVPDRPSVTAKPSNLAKASVTSQTQSTSSEMKSNSTAKRNISFDPIVLLLNFCQFPPETDRTIIVKKLLQEIKEKQNGTLDINNIYLPSQWLTPLHIACTHGYSDIAKILIEDGSAAVNITDKEGWTPLHCATAEGHLDTIDLLCKCQGNSQTPVQQREKDIIYALDGPINLAPRTDDGELPEEIANEDKVDEITKLFKSINY